MNPIPKVYLFIAAAIAGALPAWYVTHLIYSSEIDEFHAAQDKAVAAALQAAFHREEIQRDARHQDAKDYAETLQSISDQLASKSHDLLVCHRPARPTVPTPGPTGGSTPATPDLREADSFSVDADALEAIGARCDAQVIGLQKPWIQDKPVN